MDADTELQWTEDTAEDLRYMYVCKHLNEFVEFYELELQRWNNRENGSFDPNDESWTIAEILIPDAQQIFSRTNNALETQRCSWMTEGDRGRILRYLGEKKLNREVRGKILTAVHEADKNKSYDEYLEAKQTEKKKKKRRRLGD